MADVCFCSSNSGSSGGISLIKIIVKNTITLYYIFMICQLPLSLLQNNPHRTVIRPHNVGMNRGLRDTVSELTRSEKIINSPTRIIRSSISEIGPPSVGSFEARISLTEDINESDIHKCIKSSSLFERESVFTLILFRIFEVYRLVCNIEISTKYHWFVDL